MKRKFGRGALERRRLGTTAGGGTYMITLPKDWVEALGLRKGDSVELVWAEGGIYLRGRGAEEGHPARRMRLQVSSELSGPALARTLISLYIAGADVIEVEGPFTEGQRRAIGETARRLIGEILQETRERVLIQTLRDPQIHSADQLVRFVYANAQEMLAEAVEALRKGDAEQARRVIARDERVDRFFLRLSRQLYAALREPTPLAAVAPRPAPGPWPGADPLEEGTGSPKDGSEAASSRVELFNVHTVARQLERVADHAVKIAQAAEQLLAERLPVPPFLEGEIAGTHEAVRALLERAFRAFSERHGRGAHEALEAVSELERGLEALDRRLLGLENPHLAYYLGIVVDSLGRVKDYAVNIAEVALNAEALRRHA